MPLEDRNGLSPTSSSESADSIGITENVGSSDSLPAADEHMRDKRLSREECLIQELGNLLPITPAPETIVRVKCTRWKAILSSHF